MVSADQLFWYVLGHSASGTVVLIEEWIAGGKEYFAFTCNDSNYESIAIEINMILS
jgi:hypothetical protein